MLQGDPSDHFAAPGQSIRAGPVGGFIASRDDADQAGVGDCLKSASSSSDRMEVVDCSSADAEAKVIEKIKGHHTQFTAESACSKVEGATGFYAETGDGRRATGDGRRATGKSSCSASPTSEPPRSETAGAVFHVKHRPCRVRAGHVSRET
ncbi:LppU/SCO3897 family protein [Streptomyces sp. WG7]|uniref:LppU/SCO3897 family protein n=1 Tax=Streptomyces sp. WG7 TaxID=3417650 RepID=UPI003CF49AFA